MATAARHRDYCYREVVPFAAMVSLQCINVGLNTLFKVAANAGMSRHAFLVYAYAVAALILLPAPFFARRSGALPSLNSSILVKFFLLGVVGYGSQLMGFTGINYGSPTLASAISNLSPAFTFLLAIIFRCLVELKEDRAFHFHPRCKRLSLVHVCFADDLLLFTRGDQSSVRKLLHAFSKFSEVSGLKANESKSSIYFGGVREEVQQEIIEETGMTKGLLPFKYLGVPLSSKKLSVVQCQPLIQKILARIDCWSAKLLSYAGRVQLIKSVLFGIQAYWCQIFLIPQKVIKLIQAACRNFLWTGKSGATKRVLVAWEQMCLPKTAGGWNLPDIRIWNKAAVSKLMWNLAKKKDCMWIKWVHEYYIKGQNINSMQIPTQASWIIQKIFSSRAHFSNTTIGTNTLFQANFSIRKLYLDMQGEAPRVAWHMMITRNIAPPKFLFITWLAIKKRLSTCDRMEKFGVQCEQECCLCLQENESHNHLFFKCSFSSMVWRQVADWCGLHTHVYDWQDELEYMKSQCTTKSGKQILYRLVVSTVVYWLWKERNRRKFCDETSTVERVVRECQLSIATVGDQYGKVMQYLKS